MKSSLKTSIYLESLVLCIHLIFLSSCADLFAFDVRTDLELNTGYRNDSLQRKNTLELVPPEVDQTDEIKINNISIWQVGMNARFLMSPFSHKHFQGGSRFHNFYLSGFAFWGWNIANPHLRETIQGYSQKQIGRAEVNDVHTYDFQIGAGYLVDWKHWNFSFSGGYAFDKQKIDTSHGQISYPSGAPFEDAPLYGNGYMTTTIWKGAWIGIDLAYIWRHWKAKTGYEFHFAHYTANHSIPVGYIAGVEGYKTYTKANGAHGNVFFLNGAYLFCTRWELGAWFKYQHWNARDGHLTSPFFSANGFPSTTKVIASGKWISYSINLGIGCAF